MELRGILVGILALITISGLVFGRRGTLRILAGVLLMAVLTVGGIIGVTIWQETHKVRAQSADGVIHEFPAGTPPDVIDRVMKDYATSKGAVEKYRQ
jgi:hypothetical protein